MPEALSAKVCEAAREASPNAAAVRLAFENIAISKSRILNRSQLVVSLSVLLDYWRLSCALYTVPMTYL